jgi:hypothetical protein
MTCSNRQYSHIQLRRASDAEFVASDPVLASGEPAYAVDVKLLKIGDGITSWNNLSGIYLNTSLSQFSPVSSNVFASLITDETGSGLVVFNTSPTFTGIPLAPTAASGTNSNQIATTSFVRTEVANLVDSAPSVLDTLNELAAAINDDASFYVTINNSINSVSGSIPFVTNSGDNRLLTSDGTGRGVNAESNLTFNGTTLGVSGTLQAYTLDVNGSGNFASGLFVNNVPVSVSGHTHASSNITDFNESVDDRVAQLLIAGSGVNLSYDDPSGRLTLNNLHTEINVLSQEPQGFVNRTDSVISFNDSTRTFTIQPTGSSYDIYIEGVKVTKTTAETVVIGTGTALNYLHFDASTGLLHNKTTEFDFDTDVPIAYIHWNADINQSTFFGEERHGIRMDSATHKWIHRTFGVQYIEGLSISPSGLLGNGSSDLHAQVSISNGTLYQEDIIINIADGDNGVEFTQQLSPFAYIPTYYHSGSTGQWVRDSATAFPVKYNGTRAQYNLFSGGTWTTPNVPNNHFFAMWIVATNDINDPILAIVGQKEHSSLNSAENNNTWDSINLAYIPASEIKPLYRLIFRTNNSYTNTPKSSLQSILDLRESVSSTINGVTQNDHGLLFGLGDDDHSQYLHINTARTVEANHTFTNGLTISGGSLSAASGNFTSSLQLNGTNVSVSGHTHTSSDITNFNSAVSGLLPTIANSGDNRILTSTGTATGINGESNLTFNGDTNILTVSGIIDVGNLRLTTNTISSTNTNGNISLSPNGTGQIALLSDIVRVGDPNTAVTVTTNGTGNLVLNTNAGTNSGSITIVQGSNGNITIAPNGTGDVQVDADTLRVGDSNSAATITTNGTGNLTVNTNGGTNSGSIVINQGSNGNIAITPNGTGEVDLSKVDIDGGSIDNTAIGATTASTGKFTQLYPTVVSNGTVSGSVGTDVSTGQIFDMTLTGATTLSNPTNAVNGVTVRWRITQDGTGGHSVTLGSDFQIPSSASSPLPWSTAANATDILAATYHAGRSKWDVVAFVPGY